MLIAPGETRGTKCGFRTTTSKGSNNQKKKKSLYEKEHKTGATCTQEFMAEDKMLKLL
jgi:hypothetical protein